MTSEVQKFHTDDVSLPRSGKCFWLTENNLLQPIRSSTQIWVVMNHQYVISVPISQTSFHRETNGGITKCWFFLRPGWRCGEITCLPPMWLGFKTCCRRHTCGLSLLLVLALALGDLSLGTPVFPSPQKPTLPSSNLIWDTWTHSNEFLWNNS